MKSNLIVIAILFVFTACSSSSKKKYTTENLAITQVTLPIEKNRQQYDSQASNFMISTQGTGSTQAGLEVLKKGGNLFDAFTAISFAIGVERPHSTGIGGGGFVLFYSAKEKKVYAFDFRETAPRKASANMYLKADGTLDANRSVVGALAVATPGHVAGVLEVHKKYGRLKLADVLAPAIRMAEKGIPVYPALHNAIAEEQVQLALFPSTKKIFLDEGGNPWPVGHNLIQKDLGQTLRTIAAQGSKAFYEGSIAKKIAASISAHQGILSLEDLKNYKTKWRDPVKSTYRGYEIYSQPPPSSGGTHVIQILNTLENSNLKALGPQNPKSIHLTASAMQQAFYDRAAFMGDPDFVQVPVDKLISKEYAEIIRASIEDDKAKPAHEVFMKEESPDTTHFSLMDKQGNVIASTQTINGYFGSALVAEGTGIVLNNEMDDFAAQLGASNLYGAIGGKNNLIEPLKRPLSSMSPTLVMQNGKPFMALGTPSGTRIITCVAQTLLNSLEYELPLWDSVSLTRYHQQWQPDSLFIESPMFPAPTLKALKSMGYSITEKDLGCRIQAIQNKNNILHGVSDPREEGSSRGL